MLFLVFLLLCPTVAGVLTSGAEPYEKIETAVGGWLCGFLFGLGLWALAQLF